VFTVDPLHLRTCRGLSPKTHRRSFTRFLISLKKHTPLLLKTLFGFCPQQVEQSEGSCTLLRRRPSFQSLIKEFIQLCFPSLEASSLSEGPASRGVDRLSDSLLLSPIMASSRRLPQEESCNCLILSPPPLCPWFQSLDHHRFPICIRDPGPSLYVFWRLVILLRP